MKHTRAVLVTRRRPHDLFACLAKRKTPHRTAILCTSAPELIRGQDSTFAAFRSAHPAVPRRFSYCSALLLQRAAPPVALLPFYSVRLQPSHHVILLQSQSGSFKSSV